MESATISLIILVVLFGVWFGTFAMGLIWNVFLRNSDKAILDHASYMRMFLASFKLCLIGCIYSGVWILMLVYMHIDPHNHLVQLLSFFKLGSSHLIFATIYRRQLEISAINAVICLSYVAIGLVAFFVTEDEVFQWVNIAIGGACVSIAAITVVVGRWLTSGSLLVLGTTALFAFLRISPPLTASMGAISILLLCASTWSSFRMTITRVLALLYGRWSCETSSETPRETEPLL